jgi:hypothetical protein
LYGRQRLAVEVGRVDLAGDEGAAIEDDVAADLAHAGLLDAPHQSHIRSRTSFGSPLPLMTRLPVRTPSATVPCSQTGVDQV